jgi:hypothetical protein
MAIIIIDNKGNPRTFYEESYAIRAIKKLINDGTDFQVSHETMKSEKTKRYGFLSDNNEFIERLSVQKVSDDLSIWNCQKWQIRDNVISNPEPLTLPSMMAQKRSHRRQVFYYNSREISSRELSCHVFDET